jgi:carotenoid cleavage dioxygenase-like enzyme
VLAAGDLADGPVATGMLPRRVLFGFHGNWLSD